MKRPSIPSCCIPFTSIPSPPPPQLPYQHPYFSISLSSLCVAGPVCLCKLTDEGAEPKMTTVKKMWASVNSVIMYMSRL